MQGDSIIMGFGYLIVLVILNYSLEIQGSQVEWPSGQFGLPMPKTGCPQSNFTWKTGWLYQDTEDKTPSNSRSDSFHLEGVIEASSVNRSFCIKNNASLDSVVSILWPKGQYCIYKKGICPQDLRTGMVTWDDEDSENTNTNSGTLPEGSYLLNSRSTTIYFCCSTSGVKTTPISLPVDKPFYLLAYNTAKCQQVEWALASQEWIHYDTENNINNDMKYGSYPYNAKGGVNGHTIYYCYYTSCKYNLIALSGVFQSPNFPHGYPDGQLCSWRITVPRNYVVHLKFTNFSLPTNNNGDVVQIYDGLYDNATRLGSYHGVGLPSDVTSSSNYLYVVFRSDGAWNGKGFQASYHATDPKEVVPSTTSQQSRPSSQPVTPSNNDRATTFTTNSTITEPSAEPKISCVEQPTSKVNAANIVVPVICLMICVVIAGVILYRWRKMHSNRKDDMAVTYQSKTAVCNPAYFGTKIERHKNKRKEDEVSIASKDEEKQEIYHVTEKRIDNPLYESQDHLETTDNDNYQTLPDKANNNILYQSTPDSITSNILYDSIPFNHGFDETHEK